MEFLSKLNESYTIETPFARAFQKHMTRHASKKKSEEGSRVLFWASLWGVSVIGSSGWVQLVGGTDGLCGRTSGFAMWGRHCFAYSHSCIQNCHQIKVLVETFGFDVRAQMCPRPRLHVVGTWDSPRRLLGLVIYKIMATSFSWNVTVGADKLLN